jgi:pimeloyl-ACP methyl ester carboxylesterase
MATPTMDGITAKAIATPRISTRVLFSGADDGTPVYFMHGNVSSATFWEEVMLALPDGYLGIAPDQRGFGEAEREKFIDSTRGMGDQADDLASLMDTLGHEKAHFVGHSAGGSMLWRFMMDYPERILTVTMVAPGSPYGFGGTKDVDGTPTFDDFAGSGAGTVNAAFPPLLASGERGDDPGTPRNIMNSFYWKPPFVPERAEDFLTSMCSTHVGEDAYPGDMVQSPNWPTVAPGTKGLINALTPKYLKSPEHLYSIANKPPVLWVRGSDDQIVSDTSFFEVGTLGAAGAIPGYPGTDVYPPQPMIAQTRAVLDKYQSEGGEYQEVVIAETGHSPYIENPAEFNKAFHAWLKKA